MSLTHPKYQKLRDLILKSEGKTIEDEIGFGCYINWSPRGRIFKLYTGKEIEKYTINEGREVVWIINEMGREEALSVDFITKRKLILGREISLDRILMALDKISQNTLSNGIILVRKKTKDYEPINWTLGKPLHEQTEETWESLIKILS